ncbi:hypothetical protein ACFTXM_44340 [Streptomyces sp. NPDC056930]|uniref:hypothetical protein n=1 Tax=Streptomyces sp. NPDC056930 TaxID=3345967 RepID=UPI003626F2B4
MTTPLPLARELQDLRTSEIIDALDPAFLSLLSWDWGVRVARYPHSHRCWGCRTARSPDV